MTGDAKLGLLLGVGVVVAAALVYYRPEATAGAGASAEPVAAKSANSDELYRTVQLSPPADNSLDEN